MVKSRLVSGLLAFLAVALWALIASCSTSPEGAAQRAIQAAYDSSDDAAAHLNVDGMVGNCAPDFTLYEPGGFQSDLAGWKSYIQALIPQYKSISNKTQIISLSLQGTGAIVNVTEHQVITVADGQTTSTCTSDNGCRDYWVRTSGSWREERTRVLSSKRVYSGKGISMTSAFHW